MNPFPRRETLQTHTTYQSDDSASGSDLFSCLAAIAVILLMLVYSASSQVETAESLQKKIDAERARQELIVKKRKQLYRKIWSEKRKNRKLRRKMRRKQIPRIKKILENIHGLKRKIRKCKRSNKRGFRASRYRLKVKGDNAYVLIAGKAGWKFYCMRYTKSNVAEVMQRTKADYTLEDHDRGRRRRYRRSTRPPIRIDR